MRLALLAGTCLAPLGAHAQFASDTWKTAPTDGQYNNAANWVGGNIPASSSWVTLYTATFGGSSTTTISVAAPSPPDLYVGSFLFNAGAPAYTFNVAAGTSLRFDGAGIVNNSSNAPTFNVASPSSGLWFEGSSAKAGNSIINLSNGGYLSINTGASAENAQISVTGSSAGIDVNGDDAHVATLGNATVTLGGSFGSGMLIRLHASGGSARVITSSNGSLDISQLSTAGTTLGSLEGTSTAFRVLLGSKQLTIGGNNLSTSFAGRLIGTGGSIVKVGGATWTLTGNGSTYDGSTTIADGTLALSGSGSLANSSGIDLAGFGTIFDISAADGNRTIKGLSGVTGSVVVLGSRTLTVDAASSTSFAGSLVGTGGLTKQGGGMLTLSETNAYAGATTITDGTLALSGSGDIATSSGLNLAGFGTIFDISAANGNRTIRDLSGVTASVVVLGGRTLTVGAANSTSFAGSLVGTGGLTKQGGGTLTLTEINAYAGVTTITNGTLALSGNGDIATSSGVNLTGLLARFDISDSSGGGATIKDLSGTAGTVALGGKTLTVGTANSTTFDGTIEGSGGLTKQGSGTLTLTGVNTYTNLTTVTEGTLALSGSGSIAASSGLDLNGSGATFDISASSGNQTIQDLSGVGDARIVLGSNSLTVGASNSTVFNGTIEGSGGLTKKGDGRLTLGGASTYTGETTVDAGILSVANVDAVASSAKVTVATGATFEVSGTSGLGYARVQTLAGAGTVQLGDSGLEITNGSTEFSGVIADGGNVGGLRISGGALTLSGVSTYTNLTEIQQGATLALKGAGAIAASSRIEFTEVTSGVATFDISQTTAGTSVTALVENRSAIGVVALGSNELVLTGTTTDFNGSIQDGGIGGGVGGRLTLADNAQAILGGTNTYTGATTINAGATLKLVGDGRIERSSEVNLAAATSTFDISGVGFGPGGVATIRNLTGHGTVQLGSSALELVQASGEFAGKIVDGDLGGEFVVTNGSLTLTGQSTYTGMTAIGGGATLALKGTGSIAASGQIYFDPRGPSVATFDISQTTSGASVQALVDFAGLGVIELGSKTLTLKLGGIYMGAIKGTGGLTLADGAVGLTLGGSNTYTGETNVGAGAVLALMDDSSIASSSRLRLAAAGATFDISCACNTQQTVQNLDGVGGTFVMLGDNHLRVISTVDTTFSGFILGNGGLTKEGTGTLTLDGNNTYSGGTTFKQGTVAVVTNGGLGSESGALTFDGGALQFKAQFDLSITRSITLNVGGGTIDTNGFDTAIGQEIAGDGGLTKAGAGTLTLGAINTYLGATTITAGTLALSGGDISSSSGVFVATGATFDVSDNGATQINALTGGGTVKLGSSAGLVIANASGEFSGAITSDLCGCGGALAIGGGTQILSGVNTYTGITALAAGATLVLKGSGSIANSTGVLFAPFGPGVATFDISQTTAGATVLGLADVDGVGVVSLGSKTLTVGANGGPFAGVIQDGGLGGGTGGGLSVASPGVGLQLAGVNTYTGATTILAGGLLAIVGPGSIAASSGVDLAGAGATFDISGDDDDQSQTIKDLSGVAGTTVALGGNSLTVGTANSTSFAGVIADDGYYGGAGGSLTKQGSGTFTLAGVNTYTGPTTITAGTLALSGNGSIASSSGVTLAATGASLDISGASGGRTIQDLAGVADTSVVLGGNSLTVGTANNTSFAGVISGAGGLAKQGSGTLTLSGVNAYTGTTTVNAGVLALSGSGSIASSSGVTLAAIGTTFDISGASGGRTIQDLAGVADTSVVLGANSLTAGTANNTSFAGVISGIGGLAKQGSGTLTLSGVNAYTGTTTVAAGTLALSGSGSIASSSGVTLAATGTKFDISAASGGRTIQDLAGVADTSVVLGANSLTAGTANNTSFAGVISGAGGLAKQGTGTLTLAGVNAYTGLTTVNAGTLALSGGGSIASSSGVTLAATGATFDISGANGGRTIQDLAGVAGTSVVLGDNSLTVGTANSTSFAGNISGAGGLTKTGTGNLTLTGTNTYAGGTTVSGGTLTGTTTSLQGNITNDAAVVFNQATSGTYAGVMSGTGTLTKTGGGTLILTGANSYTGLTTIAGGTLQIGNGGTIGSIVGNVALSNNAILAFNRSDNVTFGGDISGAGRLMLMGPGTVTLTGASTFTGGTIVGGGTVEASSDAAFGAAGATLAVANGATVRALASFTSGRPVELLAGGGTFDTNGNTLTLQGAITGDGGLTKTGSGTLILTGANSYSGGTTVEAGTVQGTTASLQGAIVNNAAVVFDQGTDGTYAGVMSGTGSLTKAGGGTVILAGANSYTGGTMVSGGVLRLGAGASLAAGSALAVNGGTFDLNGNNQTVGTLSGTGGAIALGNGTLMANSASDSTLASAISGSGGFVKQGDGALTLTGANSYSGGTTVNGGTLRLGAGGSLASGGALAVNGGTFDLGGNSQTVGALSGTGGAIALGGGTLTANSASDSTLASVISGSGGFVKQGSGVLTFTGVNSYSGGTTVSGGTLRLGAGGSLASGGALAVNGGTFDLGGNSQTVGALSGTGGAIALGGGTLATNSASNTTLASSISGSGGLVKSGTGTLILSGTNSYTGGTVVTGGVLQGNSTSLQGAIVNNASVVFDQDVPVAGTISGEKATFLEGGQITMGGGTGASSGTLTNPALSTGVLNQTAGSGGPTVAGAGNGIVIGAGPTAGVNTTTAVSSQTVGSVYGTLSGGRALLKAGTNADSLSGTTALMTTSGGTLTLTGTNTYTGSTTVSIGGGGLLTMIGAGTYAGNMSGTGSLTKTGASALILTGTNSYSGGTIVSGGTLAGNTSSLQGNILNNAAVMFDQASNGTYAGVMLGTGTLTKAGVATLILTGANSYGGGTTVSGGVLQGNSTSLQGNILNNAAVVFDQASNGTYAGALSGSGTLTKTGAGLLNLTGNNVVGGGTTVSAGTLAVNGSLTSNVTVGSGGAIGGTGTVIGALSIGGGILSPGNSIGTLNVTGNFTQTSGVYQVEANPQGQSDKIVATGTATIGSGTTVQVLAAQGTYQRSTTYTILTATGGLTGTYAGVTSNLAFLTPSLSYDANNAFLTLELLQNAFSFGGETPNQKSVGRTLDIAAPTATGDFATVLGAIAALNTTQGPQALDTISGQPYASFGSMNVLAGLLFMNTVGQQTATARGAAFFGTTRVALGEACEVACDMVEPTRWGAWFSGMGGTGSIGGNTNAGTFTYNLGGAAVGVDYRFDPRLLVGLAIGYSSGRQWVGNFQGTGYTDTYSAALYASFNQGGFYADALAGYAYGDNRLQRVMQIPGLATRYANGGAGANQFLGQIELGYKVGIYEAAQASITPFARFQTVAASQRGFTEWGADSLNLTVQQQNTTSIRTILGADLAANMPIGLERPLGVTLRLGWVHDYADTQRPMTAAFAGAPTVPFTVVGAQPMRDSVAIGFGLSTQITASTSLYARYDGELNGRDDNHNFSAGFRMTW